MTTTRKTNGGTARGAKRKRARHEELPFWKSKTLDQMDKAEWESLCDGCGKCCLLKLEDWDSGKVSYTSVACRGLDGHTCRCKFYPTRKQEVSDCIALRPALVNKFDWLPSTCAYRLVAEKKDLEWWHPLVSGDPETIHEAGISVRGRTQSESDIDEDDIGDHIVTWPE